MLIIEDGSNVADAESFATASELKEYALKRGNTKVANLADDALEALLVSSVDYLSTKQFKGVALGALPFPRDSFDGVPSKIKQAQMSLAISASESPLIVDKTSAPKVASKKVGSVAISYHDSKSSSNEPRFPLAESLLTEFLDSGKSGAFGVAFLKRC